MVRIRTNDIFITDDDKIIFGDNFDSELFWDSSMANPTTSGDLRLTTTISGVDPLEDYHLTTRYYVDTHIPEPIYILFGLQFHAEAEALEQQTNSTSWVEALKLTVSGTDGGGVEEGEYRVGWTFEWRQDRLNYEIMARVQIDDTDTIYTFIQSPYVDVSYFALNTGFYYTGTLSSGIHYVDIDFATTDSKATSIIKNVRLEFWRVY